MSDEMHAPRHVSTGVSINHEPLNISDLISHHTSVDELATLETVQPVFKHSDLRFVAVERAGRVIGLCGLSHLTLMLGSRFGFALFGQTPVNQYLLPNPMIVSEKEPIQAVVNQALKRDGEAFYEDIAVVDEAGRLRGLVPVSRMAALQTEWLQQHARSLGATNQSLQVEIAERRQAEAVAQFARQAAERAAQAKSDFLATMSHELRTPLNAMLGFTELLQNGNLGEEESRWCTQITSSGRLLLGLISDVLDIAKIEAGRLDIVSKSVSIQEVLQTVFGHHQARANEKNLAYSFTVGSGVPKRVKVDVLRLSQIVGNLLGNAIKFTATGEVRMELAATAQTPNQTTLVLHIRDTGIGVRTEHQDRIFEKFAQADSSTTRNYGGTGLGLSISRHLAELMGGQLSLTSRYGEGSCFTLTLPVEVEVELAATANVESTPAVKRESLSPPHLVAPKPAPPSANPAEATTERPPCDVLLVEDIEANQVLATLMLTKLGCTVTLAQNGLEAITLVQDREFTFILMDCQMPEMDGYTATRRIRETDLQSNRRRIPIIAMTANAMAGDRELCLEAGMDDYFSKPFGFADLTRVLAAWGRA
jgi:signal transduction histidine kinase/CheY-like chemotaxis protein